MWPWRPAALIGHHWSTSPSGGGHVAFECQTRCTGTPAFDWQLHLLVLTSNPLRSSYLQSPKRDKHVGIIHLQFIVQMKKKCVYWRGSSIVMPTIKINNQLRESLIYFIWEKNTTGSLRLVTWFGTLKSKWHHASVRFLQWCQKREGVSRQEIGSDCLWFMMKALTQDALLQSLKCWDLGGSEASWENQSRLYPPPSPSVWSSAAWGNFTDQ